MKRIADEFYRQLAGVAAATEVTDAQGRRVGTLADGIERAGRLILERAAAGGTVFFVGNGANAGISDHMSMDFWKNGGIRSQTFCDAAILTAIGNDCGFENLFARPLETFGRPGDVLIALSSSGASPNILRAVEAVRRKPGHVITLSGFKPDNPLRTLGDLNFYVPHGSYALVEVAHHSICHCLLEAIMHRPGGPKE